MPKSDYDPDKTASVALTVADVESMAGPAQALALDERRIAAEAATSAWGLAGVGLRQGPNWLGVLLITPEQGLPRRHPMTRSGLDQHSAGLILAHLEAAVSPVGVGRRLCVSLSRRLRGQASGIEAQAPLLGALATDLAPSAEWLVKLGFEPLRHPPNRYRLDFADLASWMQKILRWSYVPAIAWTGQPAGANRVS